ncbi:MAG: hypothetical protein AAF585_01080, partial [Verrucomicrobiota bacterium]
MIRLIGFLSALAMAGSCWAEAPAAKAAEKIVTGVDAFEIGDSVPGALRIKTDTARELLVSDDGKIF